LASCMLGTPSNTSVASCTRLGFRAASTGGQGCRRRQRRSRGSAGACRAPAGRCSRRSAAWSRRRGRWRRRVRCGSWRAARGAPAHMHTTDAVRRVRDFCRGELPTPWSTPIAIERAQPWATRVSQCSFEDLFTPDELPTPREPLAAEAAPALGFWAAEGGFPGRGVGRLRPTKSPACWGRPVGGVRIHNRPSWRVAARGFEARGWSVGLATQPPLTASAAQRARMLTRGMRADVGADTRTLSVDASVAVRARLAPGLRIA
jgi:hypothetical protein